MDKNENRGSAAGEPVDLETLPGHLIRRLQQIAVAAFLSETADTGITPIQFAALQFVRDNPGLDQRRLAGAIALDTSTLAGVLDRLESRGLVQRGASPKDRRVRLLALTREGRLMLDELLPDVRRAQERILEPLTKRDRAEFMRMLLTLVKANNELSRAPGEALDAT
ncbi:MAG: MarR family transcriptional regulator [Burkholderiaceae bacterium]|jgi:DNA-binding MarR family transcriptional regulator